MTLKQLETLLARTRTAGANDNATVYISNAKLKYMRDVISVEFQKREGWPPAEWPVVMSSKQ